VYVEDVFANLPDLDTPRLRLRKITMQDAPHLFEYAGDPEVSRYTTWYPHQSVADTRQFITTILNRYKAHQVAAWGVEHVQDGKLPGTCGFVHWVAPHRRAEIGYALSRRYWNQGYTTEAVCATLTFGFGPMQLNRIEARCNVLNIASARVMEKAGMTFEGVLRQQMLVKGHYDDLKMYSILRDEFMARLQG